MQCHVLFADGHLCVLYYLDGIGPGAWFFYEALTRSYCVYNLISSLRLDALSVLLGVVMI